MSVSADPQSALPGGADTVLMLELDSPSRPAETSGADRARLAAECVADRIRSELAGCDMAILCAGLGGTTGTGATPVVARIAKEVGVLTVCLVSMPFPHEGPARGRIATGSLETLRRLCDVVIPIPSEQAIQRLAPDLPVTEVVGGIGALSSGWVLALTNLVHVPGLVNVDFADVQSIFRGAGMAAVGQGLASGPDRARTATRHAISEGYLSDLRLDHARSVLFLMEGGRDMSLRELSEATEELLGFCGSDTNLVFGSWIDHALGGAVRTVVFATEFRD